MVFLSLNAGDRHSTQKHIIYTVFENHRKSRIQNCERSELRFHFESRQKFIKNAKNGQFWRVFEKLKLAVKQ